MKRLDLVYIGDTPNCMVSLIENTDKLQDLSITYIKLAIERWREHNRDPL